MIHWYPFHVRSDSGKSVSVIRKREVHQGCGCLQLLSQGTTHHNTTYNLQYHECKTRRNEGRAIWSARHLPPFSAIQKGSLSKQTGQFYLLLQSGKARRQEHARTHTLAFVHCPYIKCLYSYTSLVTLRWLMLILVALGIFGVCPDTACRHLHS